MSRDRAQDINERLSGLNLGSILGGGKSRHPMDELDFQVTDELYLMDPRRVVLEGPYVRTWVEDAQFEDFCASVRESGEIEQPIGIRTAGPPTDRRYILIYGMRRWSAALRVGLGKVPVRDYGEISEGESVALQMVENEVRKDPHPVETALGYHLLVESGKSQADVARLVGRARSYVSTMYAVGQGIALLSEKDRRRVYESPVVGVRAFQEIAPLSNPEERRDALLQLVGAAPSEPEAAVARRDEQRRSVFSARSVRGGRSFRVQWKDEDLRTDPTGFVRDLQRHLVREYGEIAARMRMLETQQRKGGKRAQKNPIDLESVEQALAELEKALARMSEGSGEDIAGTGSS